MQSLSRAFNRLRMDHTQESLSNEIHKNPCKMRKVKSISLEDEFENNSKDSSIAQDPDSAVVKKKVNGCRKCYRFL